MKLGDYLKETSTSRADFAKKLRVDEITVYRWLKAHRFPRSHIDEIAKHTGNMVTANDFVDALNRKKRANA